MKVKYTVKLVLPTITASLGTIGKDIDVEVKRDSNGQPFFSAKHIKGILRERVSQFKGALGEEKINFIERYFGKEGNYLSDSTFTKIRFSNLTLKNDKKIKYMIGDRYGIRVNRKTRTTIPQSLFNYEFIKANGVEFEGEISFKEDINKEDLKFILASLFHIAYIGGFKSRGLRKVEVTVEGKKIEELDNIINNILKKKESQTINKNNIKNNLVKYNYEIQLEEPLILKEKEIGNYIKVKKHLQGSTIRGALIELFVKENIELDNLLNIKVSDAIRGEVPLASLYKTKYPVKEKDMIKEEYVMKDRAQTAEISVCGVKLERYLKQDFSVVKNEVSIKINEKTKSVEENMLFNTEYLDNFESNNIEEKINLILKGDVELPKDLIQKNQTYTIYLGRMKTKGFGKAKIKFKDYVSKDENIASRIIKFNENVVEKQKGEFENKFLITFDLQSDMILPFNDVYDAQLQFKLLANLSDDFILCGDRSFINASKLEGYNIINNIRKIDELVFDRGSVFTFIVDSYEDKLKFLKDIEEKGLGLRKNEGFGRVKICSSRGDK